jgi:hypothetical protein
MRAGLALQEHAHHMRGGAGARSSLRRHIGIGFEPCDEFRKIVCRHCASSDDQQRLRGQQRDRLEVLQQIVGQRVNRAVEHVRARIADLMV